ncbi:MAG: LysR family transcriptional regulator [Kordiimonadaceae bacterium]|nr:LysR family transcriptional regulator [Kordiimonadaceae bacterium]
MELTQLRYFVMVAEELHFSRAAEKLNMTQPPLSQSIKKLEEEIGASLLERGRKRHVKLTPAGQTLLVSARRILEESQRAKQSALLAKSGESGILTIMHTDDYISGWLPDLLLEFNQCYPNIYLEFFQGISTHVAGRINSGELDCLFTTLPLNAALLGCEIFELPPTPIVVVVADGHPLASRQSIKLEELEGEQLLHASGSKKTPFAEKLEQLLAKAGIQNRSALCSNSSLVEMEMVQRGGRVTFATVGSVPSFLSGIKLIPINHSDAFLDQALVWRKDNSNPTLQRFLKLTKEALQRKMIT